MAKEKTEKHPKPSGRFLFPFLIGVVLLLGSWFCWPDFEVFFITRYFLNFHSSIDPMFVLALYLITVLLAVFVLARLSKRFSLFLGTFLPLAIFLGYSEWHFHTQTLKYIDAKGLLSLLCTLFFKRTWQ